jgi:hypothetical protein
MLTVIGSGGKAGALLSPFIVGDGSLIVAFSFGLVIVSVGPAAELLDGEARNSGVAMQSSARPVARNLRPSLSKATLMPRA